MTPDYLFRFRFLAPDARGAQPVAPAEPVVDAVCADAVERPGVGRAGGVSAHEFDPGSDWPPDGATVRTSQGVATFRDGTMPGWHLTDGRYARPFDSLGLLLAQRWAATQSSPASDGPGETAPGAGEHVDHPGAPSPASGGSTSGGAA